MIAQLSGACLRFIALSVCNAVLGGNTGAPTNNKQGTFNEPIFFTYGLFVAFQFATAQNGFHIKLEASVLDNWCANKGPEFRFVLSGFLFRFKCFFFSSDCRDALAPALQLSTILVMDKAILADPQGTVVEVNPVF